MAVEKFTTGEIPSAEKLNRIFAAMDSSINEIVSAFFVRVTTNMPMDFGFVSDQFVNNIFDLGSIR